MLDGLIGRAQELGAKGLVWAFREGEGWRSPTAKFLSDAELAALNERLGAEEGDLLLIVADKPSTANSVLAQLRLDLGERFELIDPEAEEFCWVVDWPMFGFNEERGALGSAPPPVHGAGRRVRPRATRAMPGRSPTTWSGTARSWAAGSIRISDPELQQQVLEAIGIDPRRPTSASASCSRRCATARRRTAGSPTGSTASSSGSCTPTRSAT